MQALIPIFFPVAALALFAAMAYAKAVGVCYDEVDEQ